MNKRIRATDNQVKYPGHIFKIPAAIFVANAVILYEEKPAIEIILSNKGFYIASLFSSLIAYLAIRFVFWITRKLDHHYPWHRNYSKRLLLQFFCAVVLLILPLFIAAFIYFSAHKIHILNTVYMRRYIPIIFLLLMVLSLYLHYCWENRNRAKKIPKSLFAKARPMALQLPFEEIAYLYTADKNCYAVNFYGEKIYWNLTLERSLAHFPENLFCKVHRSLVVNIKAIEEVVVIDAKRTTIMLFSPLQRLGFTIAPLLIKKQIRPSARENAAFKKWYVRYFF